MSETPKVKPRRLQFLDGLRGIAAIYVMIGHARWLLWEGYSEGYLKHPEQYGMINKLLMYFFSLFKYGHEAVLFFFVLSGFVIHLKYAKNLASAQPAPFNWYDYLYRRVKRIYPPFLFAILLTILLDAIGKNLQYSIYNGTTPYNLINENIGNSNWSFQTLIGNLFFIYKAYVPVYGTNGPAWSLKFEWWFYMLYPLFLFAGTRKILYPTIIIAVLFVASFFPAYWPERLLPDILSYMLMWWLGVILAEVFTGRIKLRFKHLSLFIATIFLKPLIGNNVLGDLCTAFFFFGLISFFLLIPQNNRVFLLLERLKIIGDFSYTLYITHFPILVFISGWLMQSHGNVLPLHFVYVFVGIIITLLFAYVVHFITEIPFVRTPKKQAVAVDVKLQ